MDWMERPNSADAAIDHYLQMGRYLQAAQMLQQAMRDEPEQALHAYRLGYCWYRLDRYEEAEAELVRALQLGFDAGKVHALLGHLYMETKRWIESEQAYLEALRHDPNDAAVHAAYAYLMKKTGHAKKAEQLMKTALRLGPDDEEVVRFRHLLGLASDNRKEQLAALERYLQVADNDVSKHIQLGLQAYYRKRMRTAREHFRQAFVLDPNDMDRVSHVLLAPLRLIDKMGGPAVFWVAAIGSTLLMRSLGWSRVSMVIGFVYMAFVIYSWLAVPLVKLIMKWRG
jgi:tetratricopeptide (TPR) repeat protein